MGDEAVKSQFNVYAEINCKKPNDLLEFLNKTQWFTNSYTYRGQSDADWPITSGIERKLQPFIENNHSLNNYESRQISNLRRIAHHHLDGDQPDEDENIEWLALLQHYGGKTRLVDFSRSLFIAAYFATRYDGPPAKSAAIWAVHLGKIERFKMKLFSEFYSTERNEKTSEQRDNAIVTEALGDTDFTPGTVMLSPYRMNKRLIAQQGEFLFPLNFRKTFMENISPVFDGDCDTEVKNGTCDFTTPSKRGAISEFDSDELVKHFGIIKLILPPEIHRSIRLMCKHMNITTESLFPDLEGAIRNLSHDFYD